MLNKLASYNPKGKTFLALEHYSEHDNSLSILGLEVLLKKEELDITRSFKANSFQELAGYIKNIQKIRLVITGDNVLTKEVNNIGKDIEILSEAYPNLNLDDFYYQILKTSKKSFVTVCRKQYVDAIIQNYRQEKIIITEISLGNLKMAALVPYIQKEEILSYTSTIQFQDKEVFSILARISHDVQDYTMEGFAISSIYTLPLAIVLDSFYDQTRIFGNIDEKNQQLQNEYKESLFFKKALQYGVGFLLITLLINFFVFNAQYQKWQNLQEEIQVYTTQNESIKKQQSIVNTKEAIVNSILTTGFSKSSFYIDQVIRAQPTTVLLNSFTYQPKTKTTRSDKPISIKNNVISINGNSVDKAGFTTWLNTIEDLDFVDTVTIIHYGMDKKNTSSFEITINLTHDTTK
ncbi:hypothetical protein [Aquimarina celericrescens]|uniref:General secretion pathway protein n=1 Tax=Aquimarina celericrescens TaxID=1964542 RepID=A0ABW5ASL6_9FLAO|nr:hypothetical protein [Aquimarina celericrescens]